MQKRCISLENIIRVLLFWAVLSLIMIMALVVSSIEMKWTVSVTFLLFFVLFAGIMVYYVHLYFLIKRVIVNLQCNYISGKVIDCVRGLYFGTVRLGIEFMDQQGTIRYMRTEPYVSNSSVDLYIRKEFQIGYIINVPHQRIFLMDTKHME